jgi:hypothetical protein
MIRAIKGTLKNACVGFQEDWGLVLAHVNYFLPELFRSLALLFLKTNHVYKTVVMEK